MRDLSNRNLPKILVISASSISRHCATGITLCNLFSGYPADRIAQIYDDTVDPDSVCCGRHFRFSSADIPMVGAGKRLLRRLRSQRRRLTSADVGRSVQAASNSVSRGLLGALGDIFPFALPSDLRAWVEDFGPQIIYTPLGSVRMMSLVLKISVLLRIPVVPHFMDDWPMSEYADSWPQVVPKRILAAKLDAVLARSPIGLTISEDMSVEYGQRYGGQFKDFMNCIDLAPVVVGECDVAGRLVQFAYIGGLHLNRWKGIADVARALQSLEDRGVPVALEIYAPEHDIAVYRHIYESYSVVKRLSTLGAADACRKMLEVDVLIHVESFLPEDAARTRLSISTKIPQYMAAGKPILAYGPDGLSSIRYIERCGSGLTVTRVGDILLLESIGAQLAESSSLRFNLGMMGRAVAEVRHSQPKVSTAFRAVMAAAAQQRECGEHASV